MPEALFCVKVKTNTFILCKTVYFTRTNKCKSPIWSVKVLLKRLLHSWQIAEIIARRQAPRDVWDIYSEWFPHLLSAKYPSGDALGIFCWYSSRHTVYVQIGFNSGYIWSDSSYFRPYTTLFFISNRGILYSIVCTKTRFLKLDVPFI